MKKLLAIFLLLTLSTLAFSEIVECDNLTDAKHYIDDQSIIFCEVDDILISGTTIVSRPSFFDHLRDDLMKEGYDALQIANKLYPLWVDVHQLAEVNLSGSDVSNFVNWLNARVMPSYILTYRGPRLAYKTLDQLHSQNLYLDSINMPNHLFEDHLATFFEGCLFVHPTCNKGDYLLKFLEFYKKDPKHIVCIDTSLFDLVDLDQALQDTGISFTGIYLNRPSQELTDWDKQVGALQLEYIEEILPNHIAECLIESNINHD